MQKVWSEKEKGVLLESVIFYSVYFFQFGYLKSRMMMKMEQPEKDVMQFRII